MSNRKINVREYRLHLVAFSNPFFYIFRLSKRKSVLAFCRSLQVKLVDFERKLGIFININQGSFGQLMNIDYLDLSQNSKLEDSLTKRISPTCRTWQIEYLACEEYSQYHDEHPQLVRISCLSANIKIIYTNSAKQVLLTVFQFANTSTVAVHDDMLCEPVDEIVNFKSGPCEVSTPDTLCCDGKSHLKQIFGLPEYYWRDSCCGETAYSRMVFRTAQPQ